MTRQNKKSIVEKEHFTKNELRQGITKLNRRIQELYGFRSDPPHYNSGTVTSMESKIRETIGEIFGFESRRYFEIEGREIVKPRSYIYTDPRDRQGIFEKQ